MTPGTAEHGKCVVIISSHEFSKLSTILYCNQNLIVMYLVNNLPTNFKRHKYIVAKDLRDYTDIESVFRGYWFWGCYDSLDSAQKGVNEFRGTSIHAVIMETENVVPA